MGITNRLVGTENTALGHSDARPPHARRATLTFSESILRHGGEARGVIANYRSLSTTQQNQLIAFLESL